MSSPEKLCVFCEQFRTNMEDGYYGDTSCYLECNLGKWKIYIWGAEEDEFRKEIVRANKCKQYKPVGGAFDVRL